MTNLYFLPFLLCSPNPLTPLPPHPPPKKKEKKRKRKILSFSLTLVDTEKCWQRLVKYTCMVRIHEWLTYGISKQVCVEQINLGAVTESVFPWPGFVLAGTNVEMEPMKLLILDLDAVSISVHPHIHICSILAVCIKSDPCWFYCKRFEIHKNAFLVSKCSSSNLLSSNY